MQDNMRVIFTLIVLYQWIIIVNPQTVTHSDSKARQFQDRSRSVCDALSGSNLQVNISRPCGAFLLQGIAGILETSAQHHRSTYGDSVRLLLKKIRGEVFASSCSRISIGSEIRSISSLVIALSVTR